MEADKRDRSKPRLGLVPASLVYAVATIMGDAVKSGKYEAHNWRKGMAWSTAYDSLQRHLQDWNDGLETDKDSGKSPLWHAACDLAFLIEYQQKGLGTDDRYKEPK
jgi:hypothetical protein